MKFSENQQKAVKTRDKNILVSASAGSGKTAVLVGRVADIIKEPGNSIDSLLVVTFTKAAAAEMQSRTEQNIRKLLADPKTKNKAHLRKQLRLLNSAEITTIDSFCGRLVRRFFYKTDIAPNFTVAPESRLTEIRAEAMERVIDGAFKKYEAGEELYAPFCDLCDMVSGNGVGRLELEDEIIKIYRAVSSLPYSDRWLKETKERFDVGNYEEYTALPACKVICEGMGLKYALELVSQANGILREYLGSDFLGEEKENIEALAGEENPLELVKMLESIKFPAWDRKLKKIDEEKSTEAKALRDKAKDIVVKAREDCRLLSPEAYETYKKHLPSLKLFYSLVEDFSAEYYRLKSEKNMYEFSDIERACLNMLVDGEGRETETAAYLKKRYTEILTDEYQDTNPLQEEILKALSRENNRFMVGDIKQSIYRFRNAEPDIFARKYNSFSEERTGKDSLVCLNENYRSVPEILDFVNTVFSRIMTKDLGGTEYEPFIFPENSPLKALKRSKVQISILNRSTELSPPDGAVGEETPLLKNMAENSAEAEALLIAKKIKELMKEDNTIGCGDIVILLKKVEGVADSYISVLEKCGIPALTDKPADSTNFIENKIVLSLLRVIDNPLSDIDLVTVLHSPLYRLTTEELGLIRLSGSKRDISFYELTGEYAAEHTDEISNKLKEFFSDREYFERRFKTEPINAVLSEIYSETDYYSYLSVLNDSKKRRANLDKLLDLAEEYDETSQGGLYGFLNRIDAVTEGKEFKQAQVLSAENNAVRIMTIHGSKGLQFPVVFLSQVQSKFIKLDRKSKIVFDKNLGICMNAFDPKERIIYDTVSSRAAIISNNRETMAEGMRLYYVAMTRAERRLFITASDKVMKRDITDCEEQLEYLRERYENPLMVKPGKIPAEAVYSAGSFLPVLMSALSGKEETAFQTEYINWYELRGVTENTGREIYNRSLKDKKLIKADYPFKAYTTLPTNLSVTEIKKEAGEEEYIMTYGPKPFVFKKPEFVKKSAEALTPMEEGTAYHTVLSALDYKNLPDDISAFKEELLNKGLISSREAEAVKEDKIAAYVKSPITARAAGAVYVKKEHSFTMGLSPEEIYPDFKGKGGDEIILTHGIIDMFFEEPDGIVIVDFKTDKTDDFEGLKKMYYPQLSVYKTAVEEATGKRVKEMLLYLVVHERTLTL
ncbi:MAG: UvrD-helicase domain-containing protein [Clostridiales bacterium]|nr:UvrD-helicase domain-containing protein [Clostridiales bacterium]